MGATVTCAKRAAAFAGADGATTYVLFEQTFEKNVHPYRPDWHCLFIGHADAALERIFGRASSCEGGMLVSRHGWITPEGYLTAWLKEMAAPLRMPDQDVRLWTGTTLYAPIPPALSGEIATLLAAHGLVGEADTIRTTGSASLRLHAHSTAINALHGEQRIPAWRLIDDAAMPFGTDRDARLGLQPSGRRQHEAATPNVLSAGSDLRLLQRADGRWYCAGWSYRIVGAYVCDAWKGGVDDLPRLRARIRAYSQGRRGGACDTGRQPSAGDRGRGDERAREADVRHPPRRRHRHAHRHRLRGLTDAGNPLTISPTSAPPARLGSCRHLRLRR